MRVMDILKMKKLIALMMVIVGMQSISANLQDGFGPTFTALDELEQNVCVKFEGTWTALDELEESVGAVQSELDTAFDPLVTELQNIFTALDAIEPLACDKFEQTWTIIAALRDMVDPLICQKFNETFTALSVIVPTQCQKFEQAWVELDGINSVVEDLIATIDTGTTIVFDKIGMTWTALEGLKLSLCDKFEATWTALDEVKEALDSLLSIDFADEFTQTWTALDELEQFLCAKFVVSNVLVDEVVSRIDTLTTLVNEQGDQATQLFNETWTALAELEPVICRKFDETFTAIIEVLEDPSGMNPSIIDTYTTLIIVSLNDTVTEIQGIDSELCTKFEGTWTALQQLQNEIAGDDLVGAADFTAFFTALNAFEESMCAKFEDTWTQLECFAAQAIYSPITISESGSYCLAQDIIASGQDGIVIDASNVTLDLNGKEIRSATLAISDIGIEIAAGVKDVTIKNGVISNFLRGIQALQTGNNETSKLVIKDMCIKDCRDEAIQLDTVSDSVLQNLTLQGNGASAFFATFVVRLEDCEHVRMRNVKIQGNGGSGSILSRILYLDGGRGHLLEDVLVIDNTFSSLSFTRDGIVVNSTDTILTRCKVSGMNFINRGIVFSSASNCIVRDCCVSELFNQNNDLIGFSGDGGSAIEECCFENCSVQRLTLESASSSQDCVGFNISGDCNIVADCDVIGLDHQGANGGFCSGFRLPVGSSRNDFIRCVAECCEGVSTTTVCGFDIQDPVHNEFKDCQALNNSNTDDECFSFGFLLSDGAGGNIGVNTNIFIRDTAFNNGDPCKIDNQYFGLFTGATLDSWIEEKASATSLIPTMTPFQSLAIKSN